MTASTPALRRALCVRVTLPWAPLTAGAALLAVPGLLLAHLLVGTTPLVLSEVVAVVTGGEADRLAVVAVDARLPRAVVGLLVGALLGVSGALLQALVRNPLAAPELTGVTQGAVVGVLLWLALVPGQAAGGVPLVATAGGLTAAVVVHLATRHGDGQRLVLVGVVVSGVLSAAASVVLLFSTERTQSALGWLLGTLELRGWDELNLLLLYLLPVGALALLAVPLVAALQLGTDVAASLGVRPGRARGLVLAAAVVAAAAAVSVAGAVGFVGLVAPHLARRLSGADPRRCIPAAALLGALLLSAADLAARTVRLQSLPGLADVTTAPAAVPVGFFTALVGVPFLLVLLRRRAGAR